MPVLRTVREQIYWAYGTLAMAQSAVDFDQGMYSRYDRMVRHSVFNHLVDGSREIATFYLDERSRLLHAEKICSYCGVGDTLALDHIFPRKRGGTDAPQNLVLACKSCNSSKGKKDLLEWAKELDLNLPLLIVKRYIKLCYFWCQEHDLLDRRPDDLRTLSLPFSLDALSYEYPNPGRLVQYPLPAERSVDCTRVKDVVGPIESGCCSNGTASFSLIDLIHYILTVVGPSQLLVSTWGVESFDIQHFLALQKKGLILTARWLLELSLPARRTECCKELVRHYGNQDVRCSNQYQAVFFINPDWHISLFTRLNLNRNRGLPSYEIIDDTELQLEWLNEQIQPAFRSGLTVKEALARDASRNLGSQGFLDIG